jgi:hypothetical protein
MSSCPLYTGSKYMHYSFIVENETVLYRQWFVIYSCHLGLIWLYLCTEGSMCTRDNFIKINVPLFFIKWEVFSN